MVIAFIPVRGGSKSIPLKNIKNFCGKPLVCWNIDALERCPAVDSIVVATDSDAIAETVAQRGYAKTSVYRRLAENATDTASTESVMLEYIRNAHLSDDVVFMLVQATSPLTQTQHFSEALQMYNCGEFDSLLTCVRSYRFYWRSDGVSLNYDHLNRPRRQNFEGTLMENGAFYINRVANIVRDENRLSGRIGIYEMPEWTAMEIDEPDDWTVMESLARRHGLTSDRPLNDVGEGMDDIRLFISDVDGTLTDGGMYYSEIGDELKKFNTRDGLGFGLLHQAGIITSIITSEQTEIVKRRGEKLKVDYVIQGSRDGGKLSAAEDLCHRIGIGLKQVAYIGDDVNCLALLSAVGHAACPADACEQVKAVAGIRPMAKAGGAGCVREFIDLILKMRESKRL